MTMTRDEWKELREALAYECLAEIRDAAPEFEDPRISYVSIQVDRNLWLRCRAMPNAMEIITQGIVS